MSHTTFHSIIATAAALGIISQATAPVFAGTITIDQNGNIYSQSTSSNVLGEVSNPQIDAIMAKMKAENDALLAQFNAGEITYEQLRQGKAAIIASYKDQLQTARKTFVDSVKQQALDKKNQVDTQAERVEVRTTAQNRLRVETAPTSSTIASPLAEDDEVVFIQKTIDASEIRTKIVARNQNKYLITNGIAAKVGTPLSFNLETNEMTVTTPAGSKVVAVLPDAALIKSGFLDMVEISQLTDSTEAQDPGEETEMDPESTQISLVDYQNSPTYAIKGEVSKRFLGLVPVSVKKTVFVSAVSGNIVDTEISGIAKILDMLSF